MSISASNPIMTDLIQRLHARVQSGQCIIDANLGVLGASTTIYPVATLEDVTTAEIQLGFALPIVLRRIYTEVANGGFGPGYGLLGIAGGARDDLGNTVVDGYLRSRQHDCDGDPSWIWPEYILPVCYWGCGIYSCLDCSQADPPVLLFDPNQLDENQSWSDVFYPQMESFQRWITLWADGVDLWWLFYGN